MKHVLLSYLTLSASLLTTACTSDDGDGEPSVTTPPFVVGSNANTCLADLGTLQPVCPADVNGAPTAACCEAFVKFQADACGCSPLMRTIIGKDAAGADQIDRMVDGLTAVCPLLGVEVAAPDCTSDLAASGVHTGAVKTYNGGTCSEDDRTIEAKRFASTLVFAQAMDDFATETEGCVDFHGFVTALAPAFDAESADGLSPSVTVPYGIGRYSPLENVAEYLAMDIPIINKNSFHLRVDAFQTADSMLYWSTDGANIIVGNHGAVRAFQDCTSVADGYYELVYSFVGCSTTIHGIKVSVNSQVPTQPGKVSAMPAMIDAFYAGGSSDTWGMIDICKYHDQYCKGTNKQFADFDECMTFMRSLPKISPACGPAGALGGNSLMCRYKHHIMIPLNPSMHCYHIGRGLADPHGHVLCDDSECSNPAVLGPPELLALDAREETKACVAKADAVSVRDGEPVTPWPMITVCE